MVTVSSNFVAMLYHDVARTKTYTIKKSWPQGQHIIYFTSTLE